MYHKIITLTSEDHMARPAKLQDQTPVINSVTEKPAPSSIIEYQCPICGLGHRQILSKENYYFNNDINCAYCRVPLRKTWIKR